MADDEKQKALKAFDSELIQLQIAFKQKREALEDLERAERSIKSRQHKVLEKREALFLAYPELVMSHEELLKDPTEE